MDQQTPTEQGSAPSVQDRIGAIFNQPAEKPQREAPPQEAAEPASEDTQAASSEATEQAPTTAEEDTFEVDVEGERYRLPKKLEKGFMQEKDYTQKSQTLAEQRRAVEIAQRNSHIAELQAQFTQETQTEHQQLQALEWALAQPVDWASMSTEDALRRKLQMDTWAQEKARVEKAIGDKRKEWDGKQQDAFMKLVKEARDVIVKRIPNWGPEVAKQVTEHALNEGFTETELRRANTDPRLAVALWKAQQYDALKATVKPTVSSAKVVKTATSSPMPQHVKDKFAYQKSLQKTKPGSPERRKVVEARAASIFGR
jgi:hypothetical protein